MSDTAEQDAAPAPRQADSRPQPPREPWLARFGWIVIFGVLVFLAGLAAGVYGDRITGGDLAGAPERQGQGPGIRVEIGGLGARIGALEDRAADLDAIGARHRAVDISPLAARTEAIETAVRRLEQDARSLPALTQRLEVAERSLTRVNALEARIAAVEGVPAAVSGLAVRLAAVEATAQGVPGMAARVERAVASFDRVPDLVVRLERLEKALPDRARLAARLDALERDPPLAAAAAPSSTQPAAAGTNELLARLSNLDSRLDALEDGQQVESLLTASQAIKERLAAVEVERSASAKDVATITGRVDKLESGIARSAISVSQAVEERLAAVEAGVEGSARTDDVAIITGRVNELESGIAGRARGAEVEAIGARIDPLESALAGTAANLADVEQRVSALEEAPAGLREVAELVNAVGHLRRAMSAGQPYALELDGLRAIAAPLGDSRLDTAIVALELRAAAGVPTLDTLRERFSSLAPRLVRADAFGPDPDWVDKTLDRLSSVVSVRRVGEIEGDSVEAKVARAESRLAAGNLEGALASLGDLQGAAALALEVWLADARARLAADGSIAEINERADVHLQES